MEGVDMMTRQRVLRAVMCAVAGALLVSGCTRTTEGTTPTRPEPVATSATEPTPSPAQSRTVDVRVYFVRGEKLASVTRDVPFEAPARGAAAELIIGPTDAERTGGILTTIPPGTRVNSVAISKGTATVDLSKEFASGGGSLSMTLRVAQVVATMTEFPTVDRVAFKLDGEPVTSIGGEGVIVDPPRTRDDISGEMP